MPPGEKNSWSVGRVRVEVSEEAIGGCLLHHRSESHDAIRRMAPAIPGGEPETVDCKRDAVVRRTVPAGSSLSDSTGRDAWIGECFAYVSQIGSSHAARSGGAAAGGHRGPAQRGQVHALQPADAEPPLHCGRRAGHHPRPHLRRIRVGRAALPPGRHGRHRARRSRS